MIIAKPGMAQPILSSGQQPPGLPPLPGRAPMGDVVDFGREQRLKQFQEEQQRNQRINDRMAQYGIGRDQAIASINADDENEKKTKYEKYVDQYGAPWEKEQLAQKRQQQQDWQNQYDQVQQQKQRDSQLVNNYGIGSDIKWDGSKYVFIDQPGKMHPPSGILQGMQPPGNPSTSGSYAQSPSAGKQPAGNLPQAITYAQPPSGGQQPTYQPPTYQGNQTPYGGCQQSYGGISTYSQPGAGNYSSITNGGWGYQGYGYGSGPQSPYGNYSYGYPSPYAQQWPGVFSSPYGGWQSQVYDYSGYGGQQRPYGQQSYGGYPSSYGGGQQSYGGYPSSYGGGQQSYGGVSTYSQPGAGNYSPTTDVASRLNQYQSSQYTPTTSSQSGGGGGATPAALNKQAAQWAYSKTYDPLGQQRDAIAAQNAAWKDYQKQASVDQERKSIDFDKQDAAWKQKLADLQKLPPKNGMADPSYVNSKREYDLWRASQKLESDRWVKAMRDGSPTPAYGLALQGYAGVGY